MTTNLDPASLLQRLILAAFLLLPLSMAQAADPAPSAAPAKSDGDFSGKVLETMTTAGYTYVEVDTGHGKVWAASTQFAVKIGDDVAVVGGMPMVNFHSKTLNRTFDVVYFTGKIDTPAAGAKEGETAAALPPGHPVLPDRAAGALPSNHPALVTPGAVLDLSGLRKAEGGKTVQEIIFESANLPGQVVVLRGKVAKYNAMVMGKNWLHIQDGSGSATRRDNDLTVTTATPAKVGDTVLVTGKVTTNKDFGSGYKFAVILEDAKVTVERPF